MPLLSSAVGLGSTFLQPQHFAPPDIAAPAGAQQWLPEAQTRRRLLVPMARGRCFSPPFPVVAAPVAPAWVSESRTQRRRLLGLRRGLTAAPRAAVAAALAPQAPSRRRTALGLLQRRQRQAQPPQLPVLVQVGIPVQRRRPFLLLRRPRGAQPPWPQVVQAAAPLFTDWSRHRVQFRAWPLRGRKAEPGWPQAVQAAPPALPPFSGRLRRFLLPGRRPRPAQPPWPQVLQATPQLPPQAQRRRLQIPVRPCGQTASPTPSVIAQIAIESHPRRRPVMLPLRRRASAGVIPPAAAAPMPSAGRRRSMLAPLRRGRSVQRPWPQAIPVPPPRELGRRRPFRLLPLWPRRGRSTFRIPFQSPTPLRDVDLVVYSPRSRWSMGVPSSRWGLGSPQGRWATGIIGSRWQVLSPTSRWAADDPEERS